MICWLPEAFERSREKVGVEGKGKGNKSKESI